MQLMPSMKMLPIAQSCWVHRDAVLCAADARHSRGSAEGPQQLMAATRATAARSPRAAAVRSAHCQAQA